MQQQIIATISAFLTKNSKHTHQHSSKRIGCDVVASWVCSLRAITRSLL